MTNEESKKLDDLISKVGLVPILDRLYDDVVRVDGNAANDIEKAISGLKEVAAHIRGK